MSMNSSLSIELINSLQFNSSSEEKQSNSSQPCKAFEEDGFCMKGSQCTFRHDNAIKNVNYIEFLFEYETIASSTTINSDDVSLSKKAKKIQQVANSPQKAKIAPKSKKIKLSNELREESTPSQPQQTKEPFEIPLEYEKVNFDKPLIPFDFSYHTPTHVRQKMMEDLIEIHSKITNNKKKAIVLSFQKGMMNLMCAIINLISCKKKKNFILDPLTR